MKRSLLIMVALVLAAIIALSIVKPHQMVSPGNLMPAHASLEGNCFACHAPWRGASPERCLSCHALANIGVLTTKGVPIAQGRGHPAFHQALSQPNCMACHSDHPRPALSRAKAISFDHALVKADARARCQSCHQAPPDQLHRGQAAPCATCHQPPHWKPATFDHARFFLLDRNHNATCSICHPRGDFKQYTCFGCHEHQPAQIIAEHREEGVSNIDNCVRCHRSAQGEADGERKGSGGED